MAKSFPFPISYWCLIHLRLCSRKTLNIKFDVIEFILLIIKVNQCHDEVGVLSLLKPLQRFFKPPECAYYYVLFVSSDDLDRLISRNGDQREVGPLHSSTLFLKNTTKRAKSEFSEYIKTIKCVSLRSGWKRACKWVEPVPCFRSKPDWCQKVYS